MAIAGNDPEVFDDSPTLWDWDWPAGPTENWLSSTLSFGAEFDAGAKSEGTISQNGTGEVGGAQGARDEHTQADEINSRAREAVWAWWESQCTFWTCNTKYHGSTEYQGTTFHAAYEQAAWDNDHAWWVYIYSMFGSSL